MERGIKQRHCEGVKEERRVADISVTTEKLSPNVETRMENSAVNLKEYILTEEEGSNKPVKC